MYVDQTGLYNLAQGSIRKDHFSMTRETWRVRYKGGIDTRGSGNTLSICDNTNVS